MPKVRWAYLGDHAEIWRSLELIQLVELYGLFERTAVRFRVEARHAGRLTVDGELLFSLAADTQRIGMEILDVIAARLAPDTQIEDYYYSTLAIRYGRSDVSPT
jgi:hypothetical protein